MEFLMTSAKREWAICHRISRGWWKILRRNMGVDRVVWTGTKQKPSYDIIIMSILFSSFRWRI